MKAISVTGGLLSSLKMASLSKLFKTSSQASHLTLKIQSWRLSCDNVILR
jgi:hypothetical protein